MDVTRDVDVEASPEEVWEALATEEGRERWLEEPEREIHVRELEPPSKVVWWWGSDQHPFTEVRFEIAPSVAGGTHVTVTETAPAFPLARLAASFAMVAA